MGGGRNPVSTVPACDLDYTQKSKQRSSNADRRRQNRYKLHHPNTRRAGVRIEPHEQKHASSKRSSPTFLGFNRLRPLTGGVVPLVHPAPPGTRIRSGFSEGTGRQSKHCLFFVLSLGVSPPFPVATFDLPSSRGTRDAVCCQRSKMC